MLSSTAVGRAELTWLESGLFQLLRIARVCRKISYSKGRDPLSGSHSVLTLHRRPLGLCTSQCILGDWIDSRTAHGGAGSASPVIQGLQRVPLSPGLEEGRGSKQTKARESPVHQSP